MNENRFRAWYQSKWSRPLVLAHRGDSYHGPENTLEAAKLGLDSGADGWELDVRLTKDGIPVVIHDESLARTTDVGLRYAGDSRAATGYLVGEFLFEEIRGLDAGSWFVNVAGGPRTALAFGTLGTLIEDKLAHFASGLIRVPTLTEALGLSVERDRLVNVEIKSGPEDRGKVVEAVLAAIRNSDCLALATVSSFDHAIVAEVAAREPGVATGALIEGPIEGSAEELLRKLGADAIHAPASFVGLSTDAIPVLVYTINDASPGGLAARLAETGVAGLFTDDPVALASVLGLFHPQGAPDSVRALLRILGPIRQQAPLLRRPDQ